MEYTSSSSSHHNRLASDPSPFIVLDLPRLSQKPAAEELLNVLTWIEPKAPRLIPITWSSKSCDQNSEIRAACPIIRISNKALAQYLTSIVSSRLHWIPDNEQKEQIWELASQRLSERAGRTAIPDRTRSYSIYRRNRSWSNEKQWEIQLHEPTLTQDNLGLKTWTASHVLAQRLASLAPPIRVKKIRPYQQNFTIPKIPRNSGDSEHEDHSEDSFAKAVNRWRASRPVELPTIDYCIKAAYGSVLELGAGTGLVGITAALDYQTTVWCTDLPDIVPNLAHNVQANVGLFRNRNADVRCAILDWNDPRTIRCSGTDAKIDSGQPGARFQIVLAADVLYEPQHVKQIADVVSEWLERTSDARFVVALPKRPGSAKDWHNFEQALMDGGLTIVEQGEDIGYEDWVMSEDEPPVEVTIWWSSWGWTPSASRRDRCMPSMMVT